MKKIIKKNIIWHHQSNEYKWKDIKNILNQQKVELQDEDWVVIEYVDREDREESSYWMFLVERFVEESDEEYNERLRREKRSDEESKKRRYENYLKLKKEFETNEN